MFARYSRSGLALMGLPLYAGPLLAGWSAAPPALAAVLAALFFLMQLLAGKTAARGTMSEPVFLALLAAVQVLVVAAVYGAGVLLALATGALALPLWLPLALTGAGAAVGVLRYRHDPREAEMMALLDRATDAIETGALAGFDDPDDAAIADGCPDGPEDAAAVGAAISALWALPADAKVAQIDPIVQRLEAQIGARGFQGLLAETGEGVRVTDLAMARYLASPHVRAVLCQGQDLNFPLSLLLDSDDPAVMHELGSLTATLLDEGQPARHLPPPEPLRARAADFPDLAPLVAPVEAAYAALRAAADGAD